MNLETLKTFLTLIDNRKIRINGATSFTEGVGMVDIDRRTDDITKNLHSYGSFIRDNMDNKIRYYLCTNNPSINGAGYEYRSTFYSWRIEIKIKAQGLSIDVDVLGDSDDYILNSKCIMICLPSINGDKWVCIEDAAKHIEGLTLYDLI